MSGSFIETKHEATHCFLTGMCDQNTAWSAGLSVVVTNPRKPGGEECLPRELCTNWGEVGWLALMAQTLSL